MKTAEEILIEKLNTKDGKLLFSYRELVIPAMEEYASQFKPKWISVEDELPNNTNLCLIFKLPGIEIACYSKEDNSWIKFRNGKFIEYIGITHWMPLPERP